MKSFLVRWLTFSLVFHLLASWFSVGFYDVDEHFQILEFLNIRLTPADSPFRAQILQEMPWEYFEQMRPWLQPFIYAGITQFLGLFGVNSPFHLVFVFRLLGALLGWGSVVMLALCCRQWFPEKKWQQWAIRALCLFWCMPYFHARTSSENLSGTFFWLAVTSYLLCADRWSLVGVGFLLGLSFNARYQMAIAGLAFIVWILWIGNRNRGGRRIELRDLVYVVAGGFAAVLMEVLIDYWGYGGWVFSPWKYFYQNLILGKASNFGTSPFYYYYDYLRNVYYPLGPVLVLGLLLVWIRSPLHLLSFVSIAFVGAHSCLRHKEERFLFPLVPVIPLLLVMGAQESAQICGFISRKFGKIWVRKVKLHFRQWAYRGGRFLLGSLAVVFLIFNAGALVISSLKPSSSQPLLYQAIYDNVVPGQQVLYFLGWGPFDLYGVKIHYYRQPQLKTFSVNDFDALLTLPPGLEFWLFNDKMQFPSDIPVLKESCQLFYTVYPAWLNYFHFLEGPRRHASSWAIFRCRLPEKELSHGKTKSALYSDQDGDVTRRLHR